MPAGNTGQTPKFTPPRAAPGFRFASTRLHLFEDHVLRDENDDRMSASGRHRFTCLDAPAASKVKS